MIMQKYFKVTRNEWSELILATAEDYFALNKRMAIMRFVTQHLILSIIFVTPGWKQLLNAHF